MSDSYMERDPRADMIMDIAAFRYIDKNRRLVEEEVHPPRSKAVKLMGVGVVVVAAATGAFLAGKTEGIL